MSKANNRRIMVDGPSLCPLCKHFNFGEKRKLLSCKAFPDGIPSEFITGEARHVKPYPEDHGIRFERLEGTDCDE